MVTDILDLIAPVKTIMLRSKNDPWFDAELVWMWKQKSRIYNLSRKKKIPHSNLPFQPRTSSLQKLLNSLRNFLLKLSRPLLLLTLKFVSSFVRRISRILNLHRSPATHHHSPSPCLLHGNVEALIDDKKFKF